MLSNYERRELRRVFLGGRVVGASVGVLAEFGVDGESHTIVMTVSGGKASEENRPSWKVLLLGGAANVGKTATARHLAARCGVSVLPADAIWYALKAATDPTSYPELHYFDPPDSEWRRLSAKYWCERHIESAKAISLAMDPVIEYYLSERWPVIIEGAWITPADAARWSRKYEDLQGVFIHEPEDLRAYLLSRGGQLPDHRGETFWLFGNWVREQALANGLAVVNVYPRASLADRVLAAARQFTSSSRD